MTLHQIRIRLAFFGGTKPFGTCFAAIAVASIQLFACDNLCAQTDLSDQDPPPDPILLYQGPLGIPPTSPDAPLINDGMTVITYSPNNEVITDNDGGKASALPGLAPGQVVTVTVMFGPEKNGQTIQAFALDGGTLSVPNTGLVADANGNVTFQFQAGNDPGLYQVALRDAIREMGIQFWVINSQAPTENPAVDLPQ
jgi:hypothetical protein